MSDHFNTLPWSENVLSKIAIAVPASIYSVVERIDGSIAFTFISPYAEELHEVTVGAIMANANIIVEQIHPDDLAGYIAAMETSKVNLQPFLHEFRIITPSGKLKWIQANSRPERLPNQETVWYGMAVDVTTQKESELALANKTEQRLIQINNELKQQISLRTIELKEWEANYLALRESEEKFHLSFDKANIGMCLVDLQGNLLQVNPKMCGLFGYSQDELVGMSVSTLALPDDDQISSKFIQGAVDEHSDSKVFEKRYRHRQGRIIYGEISSSLVRDAHGNPLYFISHMQDISERKMHERELQKAHNAIAQSNIELEERVSQRTANLQAKEAILKKNERLFRSYFEQSLIGMAMTSPSKGWLNVNDKLCEILGYSFAELQELTWDEMTYPDDLVINLEQFNRVLNGESEGYEMDKRFIHKNGQIIYTRLAVQVHRKSDGTVDFFVLLLQDISDRKKAEFALQASQDFLQKVIDASPHIIYIYDIQEQRNVFVNREIETILGYTSTEVQDMGSAFFATLMHPDDLQNISAEYEHLLKAVDGEIYDYEYRMRNVKGEWRWLHSRHSVFSRDATGKVKCNIGSAQDITERKLAEQENQRLKERLEFILSSNPAVIFTCTADGENTVTFISDNVQAVMGYSAAEIRATPHFWAEHLHPEDIAHAIDGVSKLFERGFHISEYRSLHRDGDYRWIRNEMRIVRDAQGNPLEIVGFFTDIGDRKKAEEKLQQTYEKLLHATRLKDEFLASMSHELRTPLNAILGTTEILQEEIYGSINEQQAKALQTVESSSMHLLDLINDVLDVAKIEAGQMKLALTATSIPSLCAASIEFISKQALKKNIQIQTILPQQIPQIYLDERRIKQALINLLNNAVKFTLVGGQVTLEVIYPVPTSNLDHTYLRLAVRDTGIGISPESISQLFQHFVQIDSALNRKYEGTGLGLALVKQIVELHGGEVGVTSEVGVGSCFFIDLPCQN
jgi:PAS domain S-box-containing protein